MIVLVFCLVVFWIEYQVLCDVVLDYDVECVIGILCDYLWCGVEYVLKYGCVLVLGVDQVVIGVGLFDGCYFFDFDWYVFVSWSVGLQVVVV